MKKVLSIFMLFMMLAVATLPAVGIHYCGEDFRTVEIVTKHSSNEMSSCCAAANLENDNLFCEEYHKDCCTTTEVDLLTDTYQVQERLSVPTIFNALDSFWIPFQSTYLVAQNVVTVSQKHFPPDGFDIKDSDILTFFCILRI